MSTAHRLASLIGEAVACHLTNVWTPPSTAATPQTLHNPNGKGLTVSTDLFFDLAPVVRLAEHATTAATHAVDPAGLTDSNTPALWLVKGADGVWLASNGLPALPVDVLGPDAGTARVFARGWAPGNPALGSRLSALDLDPITVIGASGQPLDTLRPLLDAGHERLRITVHPGGGSLLRVNDQERDGDTGQDPEPVTAWLRAETGEDITGRPWRDDLDHPCRAHVELAELLDEVADSLQEETDALLATLHDLSGMAGQAATDLDRHGWTSGGLLAGRTLAQHAPLARHEILRNLATQLYAAWRNTRVDCGGCHPVRAAGDDATTVG